ncbi:hypothetical protein KY510_002994 [Listeria monocytogenes]|nr:hypothetical protein [Listeria monocytogenes]
MLSELLDLSVVYFLGIAPAMYRVIKHIMMETNPSVTKYEKMRQLPHPVVLITWSILFLLFLVTFYLFILNIVNASVFIRILAIGTFFHYLIIACWYMITIVAMLFKYDFKSNKTRKKWFPLTLTEKMIVKRFLISTIIIWGIKLYQDFVY